MTDRLKGCWVAFDRDIREDDAEQLIQVIRCLKGVLAVETSVTTFDDYSARVRVKRQILDKVWAAIKDMDKEEP